MLRFCDSFQHWATADLLKKWTSQNGSGSITANGLYATNAWGHSNTNDYIEKLIDSQATWIVGVRFKVASAATDSYPIRIFDDTTEHVRVKLNGGLNTFSIQRGDTTTLGTGSYSYVAGSWVYLELKTTIHDSTGVAVLKINGSTTDINLSGVDTRNGANSTANRLRVMGNANVNNQWYINDLYMCDTQGSTNNDFLGDVRVEGIFANGNGTTSQLVGQDANSTDNYLNIDESAPDDDTTYNESGTVGQKDTYNYASLVTTSGTVYGVQVLPYARKTDAGARSICSVARLSGNESDSANSALGSSYVYLPDIRETKPGGGSWSISDINNAEFGVKVTA